MKYFYQNISLKFDLYTQILYNLIANLSNSCQYIDKYRFKQDNCK